MKILSERNIAIANNGNDIVVDRPEVISDLLITGKSVWRGYDDKKDAAITIFQDIINTIIQIGEKEVINEMCTRWTTPTAWVVKELYGDGYPKYHLHHTE
jgi:hypothetical protein